MFKKKWLVVLCLFTGTCFASTSILSLSGNGYSVTVHFCSKMVDWQDGVSAPDSTVLLQVAKFGEAGHTVGNLSVSDKTDQIAVKATNTQPITNMPADAVFVMSDTTGKAYAAYNMNTAEKCADTLSGNVIGNIDLLYTIQEGCPTGPVTSC